MTKIMLVYLVLSFQGNGGNSVQVMPSMDACRQVGEAFAERHEEVNGLFHGAWNGSFKGYDCFEVEVTP